MSVETTSSPRHLVPEHERLSFSGPKFGAWISGLIMTVLGGFLCDTPVGMVLGLPTLLIGIFVCLSFSFSMSATRMPDLPALGLLAICLLLVVVGRACAPIDQLIESFREAHTLMKLPSPAHVFGIPLLMVGVHLAQLVTPWIRTPVRMSLARNIGSAVLVLAGSLALLVGAVMTTQLGTWRVQPFWAWLAVPALLTVGVGVRRGWDSFAWPAVLALTAVTLPLAWLGLQWGT